MFRLLSNLAFLFSLSHVVQASYDDEVSAASTILSELPATLASPFCSDYISNPTAAVTTTTTLPCTPTSTPQVITVSSTTTLTFTITSTIFVAPTYPASYKRATWCSDYDLPCRLVQYSSDVIEEACKAYLDSDSAVPDAYPATVTATVTPTTCGTGYEAYPTSDDGDYEDGGDDDEGDDEYDDDQGVPAFDDGAGDDGYGSDEGVPAYENGDADEEGGPNWEYEDGNDK